MKALLLVAHGSRRQASNDEVRALTEAVREENIDFDVVSCAFLELAEPSIPDGLRLLIGQGAEDIVVLPYFLSAGRHVVEDIPREVQVVTGEFPGVQIHQAPYLGASPEVTRLLLRQAKR